MILGEIGLDVFINENSVNSSIELLRKRVATIPGITIKATVDDSELFGLNKHLDKKVSHLNFVRNHYKNNPIKVYTDTREIEDLRNQIRELKSIKVSVDRGTSTNQKKLTVESNLKAFQSDFDKVVGSFDKIGDRITRSIQRSVKNSAKQITSPFTQVFTGVFENVGRDITQPFTSSITSAIQKSIAPSVGSTELLGEALISKAIPSLTKKIGQALPGSFQRSVENVFSNTKIGESLKNLQQGVADSIGQEKIVAAQRSLQYKERQQQKRVTKDAIKELTQRYEEEVVVQPTKQLRKAQLSNREQSVVQQQQEVLKKINAGTATQADRSNLAKLSEELSNISEELLKITDNFGTLEQQLGLLGVSAKSVEDVANQFKYLEATLSSTSYKKVPEVQKKITSEQQRKADLLAKKETLTAKTQEIFEALPQTTDKEKKAVLEKGAKERIQLIKAIETEIVTIDGNIAAYKDAITELKNSVEQELKQAQQRVYTAREGFLFEELKIPKKKVLSEQVGALGTERERQIGERDLLIKRKAALEMQSDDTGKLKEKAESTVKQIKQKMEAPEKDDQLAQIQKTRDKIAQGLAKSEEKLKTETDPGKADKLVEDIEKRKNAMSALDQTIAELDGTALSEAEKTLSEITGELKNLSTQLATTEIGLQQYRKNIAEIDQQLDIQKGKQKQARKINSNVPASVQTILDEVVKESGYKGTVTAPQFAAFTKEQEKQMQEQMGKVPNAMYDPLTNKISVSQVVQERIKNNQLAKDDILDIAHELRHAVQSEFGQIDITQNLGSGTLLRPNAEEIARQGKNIEMSVAMNKDNEAVARANEGDAYAFTERKGFEIVKKVLKQQSVGSFEQSLGIGGAKIQTQLFQRGRQALSNLENLNNGQYDSAEIGEKFLQKYQEIEDAIKPLFGKLADVDNRLPGQIDAFRKFAVDQLEQAMTAIDSLPNQIIDEAYQKQIKPQVETREMLMSPLANKKRVVVPLAKALGISTKDDAGKILGKKDLVDRIMEQASVPQINAKMRYIHKISDENKQEASVRATLSREQLKAQLQQQRQQIKEVVGAPNANRSTQELSSIAGMIEHEYEITSHMLTLDLEKEVKNLLVGNRLFLEKTRRKLSQKIVNNLNNRQPISSQVLDQQNVSVSPEDFSGLAAFNLGDTVKALRAELLNRINPVKAAKENEQQNAALLNQMNQVRNKTNKVSNLSGLADIYEELAAKQINPQPIEQTAQNLQGIYKDIDESLRQFELLARYLDEYGDQLNPQTQLNVRKLEQKGSIEAGSAGSLPVPRQIIEKTLPQTPRQNQSKAKSSSNKTIMPDEFITRRTNSASNLSTSGKTLSAEILNTASQQRLKGSKDIASELEKVKQDLDSNIKAIDEILSKPITQDKIAELDTLSEKIRDTFTLFGEKIPGDTFDPFDEFFVSLQKGKSTVLGFFSTFAGIVGLQKLSQVIIDLLPALRESVNFFERTQIQLRAISDTSGEASAKFEIVRQTAKSLGLDLKSTLEGFTKLSASTVGTNLEGEGTLQTFKGFSETGAVRQLSPADMALAFEGVSQVASKGQVFREELVGQIAERIPGVLQTAARSRGMDVQELNREVEKGISAEDFLPRLGQQMSTESMLVLDKVANSSTATMNRYNNAILELQGSLGKPFVSVQNTGISALTKAMEFLNSISPLVINAGVAIGVSWGINLAATLGKSAIAMKVASLGLSTLSYSAKGAVSVIGGAVGKFLLLTAALESLKVVSAAVSNQSGELKDFAEGSAKALDKYKLIQKETGNTSTKQRFVSEDSLIVDNTFLSGLPKTKEEGKANIGYYVRRAITKAENAWTSTLSGGATYSDKVYADRALESEKFLGNLKQINEETTKLLTTESALKQIQSIDAQLNDVQRKRRGVLATTPENKDEIARLKAQEQQLLKTREQAVKPVSALQAINDQNIQSLKSQIKIYEDLAAQPGKYQKNYQEMAQTLKESLESTEQTQRKLNAAIREGMDNFTVFLRRSQALFDFVKDSDTALNTSSNAYKTEISNAQIQGRVSPQQASLLAQQTDAQVLNERLRVLNGTMQQLSELFDSKQSDLQNLGVSSNTGIAEIETRLQESSLSANDKALLERYKTFKELQTEQSNVSASLSSLNASIVDNIYQSRKSVTDFFRTLSDQTEQLNLELMATKNTTELTRAKSKLKSALVGQQETFVNSYVDSLTSMLEILNQPVQEYVKTMQTIAQDKANLVQQQLQINDLNKQLPTGAEIPGVNAASTPTTRTAINTGTVQTIKRQPFNIVESVGGDVQSVHDYHDLEVHHPSRGNQGKEAGRAYQRINNRLEEVIVTHFGNLIKKDFVLSQNGNQNVAVPSPAAGVVSKVNPGLGQVQIRDLQGKLIAEILHMVNLKVKEGDTIQYGQSLGTQGGAGGYAVHTHIALFQEQFEKYIKDLKTGVFNSVTNVASQAPQSNFRSSTLPKNTLSAGMYANTQNKLTPEFIQKASKVAAQLGTSPENLLAVMGFETGGTYSPSITNSLGYTGLIQFSPRYAPENVGKSTAQLRKMSAIEQLDHVAPYINKNRNGKSVASLEDLYMSVLMPIAIGKGSNHKLPGWAYSANRGLDINKDGAISVSEATSKVRDYYRPMSRQIQPQRQRQQQYQVGQQQTERQQQQIQPQQSSVSQSSLSESRAVLGKANSILAANLESKSNNAIKLLESQNDLSKFEAALAQQKVRTQLRDGLKEQSATVRNAQRAKQDVMYSGEDSRSKYQREVLAIDRKYEDSDRDLKENLDKMVAAREQLAALAEIIKQGGLSNQDVLDQQLPDILNAIAKSDKQILNISDILGEQQKLKEKELEQLDKRTEREKKNIETGDRVRQLKQEIDELNAQADAIEKNRKSVADLSLGDPLPLRNEANKKQIESDFLEQTNGLVQLGEQTNLTKEQIDQLYESMDRIRRLRLESNDSEFLKNKEKDALELINRDLTIKERNQEFDQNLAELKATRAELQLKKNPNDYSAGNPQKIRLQQQIGATQLEFDRAVYQAKQFAFDQGLSVEETKKLIDGLEELNSIKLDNLRREMKNVVVDQLRAVRQSRIEFQNKLTENDLAIGESKSSFFSARGLGIEAQKVDKENAIQKQQFDYQQQLEALNEYARVSGRSAEEVGMLRDQLTQLNELKLDNIKTQFDPWQQVANTAINGISSSIAGLIDGTKSFGDVFQEFGQSIAQTLTQLASQWVTNELVKGIFGINPMGGGASPMAAMGGGSGGGLFGGGGLNGILGGLGSILGFKKGGVVPNYASGGMIRNMDNPIGEALRREGSNSVLAALTPRERVLTVEEAGIYNMLYPNGIKNALKPLNFNDGGNVPSMNLPSAIKNAGGTGDNINLSVNASVGEDGGKSLKEKELMQKIRAVVIAELKNQKNPGGILS